MAEYLSPGVYVEEFDSGPRHMEGVGTGIAGFVGAAQRGPVEGLPQLVTNFAEFRRIYGGYLSADEYGDFRFLAYAVEHFFINGGSRAFIVRVAPKDAACASGMLPCGTAPVLALTARNPGIWGNNLKAVVTPSSKAKTQIYEILTTDAGKSYSVKNGTGFYPGDVVAFTDGEQVIYNRVETCRDNIMTFENDFGVDVTDKQLLPAKVITTCEFNMEVQYEDIAESYSNLSFNMGAANFVEKIMAKSDLVRVEYIRPAGANGASGASVTCEEPEESESSGSAKAADIMPPFYMLASGGGAAATADFKAGSNGSVPAMTAADFIGADNGAGRRTGIQAFADNDAVSVMAVPGVTDPDVQLSLIAHCENLASRFAVLDIPRAAKNVQDIINHRNIFDSTYAALYHPWIMVFDPLDKRNLFIPPSGSVIGIYARSDKERGVHKAPANEVVRSCVGLDVQYNDGEQSVLNPKGVNLIRAIPGQGIRVWGARTVSGNGNWKYINVRRLTIFIEETIKANTSWVIFEPNEEILWLRVKRTIEVFLANLWRDGALAGASPDEAFFVDIGYSTMSRDDIDNGRLVCVVGVAPVKPAEFVIMRITQKTGDAQSDI